MFGGETGVVCSGYKTPVYKDKGGQLSGLAPVAGTVVLPLVDPALARWRAVVRLLVVLGEVVGLAAVVVVLAVALVVRCGAVVVRVGVHLVHGHATSADTGHVVRLVGSIRAAAAVSRFGPRNRCGEQGLTQRLVAGVRVGDNRRGAAATRVGRSARTRAGPRSANPAAANELVDDGQNLAVSTSHA